MEIVGGIVGYVNENTTVICNSYNLGTVYASKGDLGSGGILGAVGPNNATTNIVNCYNAGGITGNRYKGGIVGVNYGKLTIGNAYYLDNIADALGINFEDRGATSSIMATQMTDANMKGAVDVSSSIAYVLNEYVNKHFMYTFGKTDYVLKLWNVTNNNYPTLGDNYHLIGIAVTYNGGDIAKGNKIQGDDIVITATYSDDTTATVSATDGSVTYSIDETPIADITTHRFMYEVRTVAVTVKYGGQEAEMNITVVEPILTGIALTYPGGVIYRNHNIQSDNIGITATYSDDSTSTVSATDENVTYWIDREQIENFADYIFNKLGIIAVTVKYSGQEAVMNLIVVNPILMGITANYTGGDIAKGNKMQGPYIQITAMYSDDSTRWISPGDEYISYWLGKKILDKPAAYRFNTMGTIAVTVKYQGYEAVMNITVVEPILTGITVNYNGGVIFKDEKIQCDKIEIIATYSDDSTETVSTDNENVSYWVDKAEIEDFFNYVFDEERQYEVTVKYNGREAKMNLTVIATYWTDMGYYDTSWYVGNESDTEYILTTPAQFAGLAYLVNNDNNDIKMFNGKTIKLGDDIDLNGHKWTPIGNNYVYYFAGTFDGQGYTISNMIVRTNDDNAGLFGLGRGATIRNVILDSSCSVISTANNVGGIVGEVSINNTNIENVINNGTMRGKNCVGGIVGNVNDALLSIKNVTNNANISGTYCVGGILGCTGGAYGRVSIKNATNSGAVSGIYSVGGIAGECNGEIENVTNSGEVTGTDGSVGGIAGVIRSLANNDIDFLLINCNNTAGISGRNQIGGIVGCVNEGAVVICNSYNVGTLYTSQNCFGIGGILGAIEQHNAKVTVSNCYNAGEIIGTDIIGGIVGLNFGTLVVDNVYYLDNIVDALGRNVEDQGATYTGTATQMNESDIKGDSDNINSLIYKLNEYVNEHPTYMVGSTEYALKLWSLVAENVYPMAKENGLSRKLYNEGLVFRYSTHSYDNIVTFSSYGETVTILSDE